MEKLMQYVWQTGLWGRGVLQGVCGERIEVIDRGALNTGQGPDFFNAKVMVDGQLWAGNVELHVRASDWHRHGHDGDTAYDNVVLHVVSCDDARISVNGRHVVQVVMPDAGRYAREYARLTCRDHMTVGCAPRLACVPALAVTDWLSALGFERLQRKAAGIHAISGATGGDWSHTIYVTLARGLGFGTNAQAMELTARATPLHFLGKHADSLMTLEAMLMGQAGLLDYNEEDADSYTAALIGEYRFMATKFSLKPISRACWKLGGVRPQNSPWRRLALLAALIGADAAGGDTLSRVTDIAAARRIFDVELSAYWRTHCSPGVADSHGYTGVLSQSSRDLLIINVIAPLIYARGEMTGNYALIQAAPAILESLKPERNSRTRVFEDAGIHALNALDSQALIELYNNYCVARRCLSCRFAHRLLAVPIS